MKKRSQVTPTTRYENVYTLSDLQKILNVPDTVTEFTVEQDLDNLVVRYTSSVYKPFKEKK